MKDYFELDIELSDKNGIDIYRAESADEIFEFLTKPIPMCAYCDRKHITMGHAWEVSNKSLSEWTLESESRESGK